MSNQQFAAAPSTALDKFDFFYQDLFATTRMPDLPFAGGSHKQKLKKSKKEEEKKQELNTHTLIHTHICSYTP